MKEIMGDALMNAIKLGACTIAGLILMEGSKKAAKKMIESGKGLGKWEKQKGERHA